MYRLPLYYFCSLAAWIYCFFTSLLSLWLSSTSLKVCASFLKGGRGSWSFGKGNGGMCHEGFGAGFELLSTFP